MHDASGMEWLAPGRAVADGAALDVELRAEIVKGHPLHGLKTMAVGTSCRLRRRVVQRRSSVLQSGRSPPDVANQGPNPIRHGPISQLFAAWEDWIANCMKPDNADYQGEGG